jgi:hypothetical protein
MTDMSGSEPDPATPPPAGWPAAPGDTGGEAGGAGGWAATPGGAPGVATWGNEPAGPPGGTFRGADGVWPALAAAIGLLVLLTAAVTWTDMSARFGERQWTYVATVFVGQGTVGVLAQLACAAVARGAARRTAAGICMGTAVLVVLAAVAMVVSAGDNPFARLSGGWSLRVNYLADGVIVAAFGLVARRLMRDA